MSQDPVARSDALDATLSKNPIVTNLVALSEQHGRIIKWLIRFAALGAAILVSVIYVAWQAHEAANTATHASSQTHVNCLSANQARATQRQLWTFILSFPPPLHETAEAKRRRIHETTRFKVFVHKKFAPLDCTAATPAPVPAGHLPPPLPSSTASPHPTAGSTAAGPPAPLPAPHPAPSPTTERPRPTHRPTPRPPHSPRPSPTAHPTPTPTRTPLCLPVICKPTRLVSFVVVRWLLW